MEIYWTKTKTVVSLCLLAFVAAVALVKWIWFPYVDETFFSLDYGKLRRAPANVVILRPTQFAESRRTGVMVMPFGGQPGQYNPDHLRMVGRNVGLNEVIAVAYQCQSSQVLLPADAPTNHLDFLVTVHNRPAAKLQAAVKQRLHYVAHMQDTETEVFQLKAGSDHSGLQASPDGEKTNVNYKNGRLYFQHFQISQVAAMAQDALGKPVEDQTGLTGYYDFSVLWDYRTRSSDPESVKKSLAELGLHVVSTTETLPMMKVEKAF